MHKLRNNRQLEFGHAPSKLFVPLSGVCFCRHHLLRKLENQLPFVVRSTPEKDISQLNQVC